MLETKNFEIPRRRINPQEFAAALKFLDEAQEAPILLAAMARDSAAFSWRDFVVGCAVAYEVGEKDIVGVGKDTHRFSFAGNFKRAPGPKNPKTDKCAERKALETALSHNPKFIFAIYTVSKETEVDTQEVARHDVLHPCRECRDFLRKTLKEGIISPATRLISVKDGGRFWDKKKGPFDIIEYAKNYKYEKRKVSTIGEFLQRYVQEDLSFVS